MAQQQQHAPQGVDQPPIGAAAARTRNTMSDWLYWYNGLLGVAIILGIAAAAHPDLITRATTTLIATGGAAESAATTLEYGLGIFRGRVGDLVGNIDCSNYHTPAQEHKCGTKQAFTIIGLMANSAAFAITVQYTNPARSFPMASKHMVIGAAAITSLSYLIVISVVAADYHALPDDGSFTSRLGMTSSSTKEFGTAFALIMVGFLFSLVATIVAVGCYVPGPNAAAAAAVAVRHYEPLPNVAAGPGGAGLQGPLAVEHLAQRHALEMQQLVQRQALEAAPSWSDSNCRSKGAEAALEGPNPFAANFSEV